MTKLLTLVVRTDDGCVETHCGIEHDGGLWLVTGWLANLATDQATPERMIRVDIQAIEKCPPGGPFDYTGIVLPRDVLDGDGADAPGYEVRQFPDSPVVDRRELKLLPSVFPRH
jgi:hypothetical protein